MLTAARFASKVACEANSTFGRRSISTILTNVSFFFVFYIINYLVDSTMNSLLLIVY